MSKRRIIDLFRNGQPEETVTVQGWVRTKRESKKFAFIEVNDGSALANLQVILEPKLENYEQILTQVNTGASVEISGVLAESPGKGQRIELQADAVTVYGEADPET